MTATKTPQHTDYIYMEKNGKYQSILYKILSFTESDCQPNC